MSGEEPCGNNFNKVKRNLEEKINLGLGDAKENPGAVLFRVIDGTSAGSY